MSFISENVIPGNYGKKFTTDANDAEELELIKQSLMNLEGIENVIFEEGTVPVVFVIQTNKIVSVKDITDRVQELNLHAVPTGAFFPLA